MRTSPVGPRGGRVVPWLIATLLVVFGGMVAYTWWSKRARFASDAGLVAELADATFVEDEPADPPKDYPWPQWLGPRRDGVVHDPQLLTKWPARGPKRLWGVEGGDGYSSFAVGRGKLYTLLTQEDRQEAVVCWQADGKKEVWRHAYQPGASYQYGGPRATPTLVGDRLYALGSANLLLCLNADTGKVEWQRDLRHIFPGGSPPNWGYACSPLVEGGRVFVMPGGDNGGALAALDKKTGEVLWSALDDRAGYSSPIAVTIAGVPQVIFFTATRVVGVSPEDGKLLWDFPWKNNQGVNAATPVHFRARLEGRELDYVFVSTGYGKGCALVKVIPDGKGSFRAGRVWESNALRCHFSTPVRYKEFLYGLDEEADDLTCLDLRTGEVRWRLGGEPAGIKDPEAPSRRFYKGSLIRVDRYLLLLSEEGALALVEADPKQYREVAFANRVLPSKCWTVPALADGRLYLRDRSRIVCLDVRKR